MAAVGVAALAALLVRNGVLLDPDSATYLRSAGWFRADPSSFFDPPTGTTLSVRELFAPLYAVALAAVGGPFGDLAGARVLGIAVAAACGWLLAHLARPHVRPLAALGVVAVVAAGRGWLVVDFAFALSEGLHLLLVLLTATVARTAIERSRDVGATDVAAAPAPGAASWKPVVLVGLAAAGAFATRYVGLGTVAGAAAATGLLSVGTMRSRCWRAAAVAVVGAGPTLAWRALLEANGGTGTRGIGLRPFGRDDLRALEQPVQAYVPRPVFEAVGPGALQVAGALLLLAAIAWSVAQVVAASGARSTPAERTVATLLLLGWGHLGVLVATRAFVDLLVPLGGRHTMAWWTCLVAAVGIHLAARGWSPVEPGSSPPKAAARRRASTVPARAVVAGLAGLLVLGGLPTLVRAVADPTEAWSNLAQLPPSSLMAEVDALPAGTVVATNREDLVWLETGRPTVELPHPIDEYSGEPDPGYEAALADVVADVRAGRTVVALFDAGADTVWATPRADLVGAGLAVTVEVDDGVLLRGAGP